MSSPRSTLLDPLTIAQLGNVQLRARRILEGLYSGHHVNRIRGTSKEFSEHRAYYPGDDLKSLDWKVLARTDRLVVKEYNEETNLLGLSVIDTSASMNYSDGGRISKLEYAKTLGAALGYLLVSQHDAMGLYSDTVFLPAKSTQSSLDPLFSALDALKAEGEWNVSKVSEKLGAYLKKRSFIFLFSDLMHPTEEIGQMIKALHSKKHEILVFQILDPSEKDLPFEGSINFEDSETHQLIRTEPDVIRKVYQDIVQKNITEYEQMFRSLGVEYRLLTTDTPFDKGLGHYLSWRGSWL